MPEVWWVVSSEAVGLRRVCMVVLEIVRLGCLTTQAEVVEDKGTSVPVDLMPLGLLHQDQELDRERRLPLQMEHYPLNTLAHGEEYPHLPVGRRVLREGCKPFSLSRYAHWLFPLSYDTYYFA
jgi:hypothetical protein